LEINPQYSKAWSNKGASLNGLGRCAEAIKCFDRALEINPQHAVAWLNKGVTEDRLGLRRDAVISYRKFLELAPDAEHGNDIEFIRKRLLELEGR